MVTEPATGLSFIELSHEWGHYTPAFPGYADIQIHRVATIAKQGVLTQHVVTSMHHGTHLNAPIHLAQRCAGVGELPLDAFFGTGVVLNVPKGEWEYPGPADLESAGEVRPADIGRLGVAHCMEGRKIFGDLTVEENLLLGARAAGSAQE